jgi:hypothetical protein
MEVNRILAERPRPALQDVEIRIALRQQVALQVPQAIDDVNARGASAKHAPRSSQNQKIRVAEMP